MILFVTDSFLQFQQAPKDLYFSPQLELLAKEGIHHFEMIWSDDEPIAQSASKLRDEILRYSTPVVLIGHGKGGLDALECLIRYPEIRPLVQKFVCVQAPIWGTPVADYLVGHPFMRLATELVSRFLGANITALEELSEMNRQVYMILNKSKLVEVLSEVEIVTVGSTFEWEKKSENWKDRLQKHLHKIVKKYAGDNDGYVPLQSTRIGNEPHVHLFNVTHLGSVTLDNPPELVEVTRQAIEPMSSKPSGYRKPTLLGLSVGRSAQEPGHPSQLEIS